MNNYAGKYLLLESLEQARLNLAQGQQRIIRQRELVAALMRDGFDASEAKNLLFALEEMQATYVDDVGRFESRLAHATSDRHRT